jgi:hypothetical protein
MIPKLRKNFNDQFTETKYQQMLDELNTPYPNAIEFRIAETPVFISKELGKDMINTCEGIIDQILSVDFKSKTEKAIPWDEYFPKENQFPHFIAFDFGICQSAEGILKPALIEMQGFPTLFGLQAFYPEVLEKHFEIPSGFSNYFNGLTKNSYLELLKKTVLGDCNPEEVILLEIQPHQQKTRIDFYLTQEYLGIQPVCITELEANGDNIYYRKNGSKIRIRRIYNRVIMDELKSKKQELGTIIDLQQHWDVEWIPHPNWFYRVSKYTLPHIKDSNVPETRFLNELNSIPQDLENFVLKPLFSFAGQGVIIDVNQQDIDSVEDKSNWILQKKVNYASCIQTPGIPAKVEVRLMYIWPDGYERPILATNLARLSKGKMIGVRYNQNHDWVGGSVAYFEQ